MKGFIGARQTTLASEISITGTGVHSGAPVSIILYPADGDTGLRFLLSNGDAESTEITADQRYVTGVTLCTVLATAMAPQWRPSSTCLPRFAALASTTP